MKKIAILAMAAFFIFSGLNFLKYEKRISALSLMMEEGDYRKAVAGLESIEKSYYGWILKKTKIPLVYPSQYGRILVVKGISFYELGEMKKAKKIFFEARNTEQLKGDKRLEVLARYNLARIMAEENDFINAAWEYTEVLKIDPENYKAKANLELISSMKEKAGLKDKDNLNKKRGLSLKDLMYDLWLDKMHDDSESKKVPRW